MSCAAPALMRTSQRLHGAKCAKLHAMALLMRNGCSRTTASWLARQQQHAEQALAGVAEQSSRHSELPMPLSNRLSRRAGQAVGRSEIARLKQCLRCHFRSIAWGHCSFYCSFHGVAAARPADSSSGASSVDGAIEGRADPHSAGAAPGGPNAARRDGSHQVPTSATSMADLYSPFRAMMAPPGQLATQPQDTVAARREAVAAQRQAAATRRPRRSGGPRADAPDVRRRAARRTCQRSLQRVQSTPCPSAFTRGVTASTAAWRKKTAR